MSAQQKNAAAYKYKVTRSEEDGEYVGTCDKYPRLSYQAKSPAEALRGIIQLEAAWADVTEDIRGAKRSSK